MTMWRSSVAVQRRYTNLLSILSGSATITNKAVQRVQRIPRARPISVVALHPLAPKPALWGVCLKPNAQYSVDGRNLLVRLVLAM